MQSLHPIFECLWKAKQKRQPQVDMKSKLKGQFTSHHDRRESCRVPHPSRVDHAFGSPGGAWRVHDEQRMAEGKLLKLQLRLLIQLVATRCQEVVDEYAERGEDGCRWWKMIKTYIFSIENWNHHQYPFKPWGVPQLTWSFCIILTHLLGILERSVSCLERAYGITTTFFRSGRPTQRGGEESFAFLPQKAVIFKG